MREYGIKIDEWRENHYNRIRVTDSFAGAGGMEESMKEQLIQFNEKKHLFDRGDKIVAGVSGGADSVCLLQLLNEIKKDYGLSLFVLHVNHGIREGDAEQDAEFVEQLADSMGLPFCLVKKNVPELAADMGMTEEEAGRYIRYEELENYRERMGADRIAIAHHRDDVAETMLFQLFRGSGPRGLAGIPAKRGRIIRPLAFAGRAEIESYMRERGLPYREDKTNDLTEYTRNKIRLQLLPYVEREINSRAGLHAAQAAEKLTEWREYIEKMGQQAYEQAAEQRGGELRLSVPVYEEQEKVIQGEILRRAFTEMIPGAKDVSQSHYEKVGELVHMEPGKRLRLPKGIVAEKCYDCIRFFSDEGKQVEPTYIECKIPSSHIVDSNGTIYEFSVSVWKREELEGEIPQKDYTKWFDYDKINSDLVIRNPREEDFFVLDENGGTKKLNRYYIDRKIPRRERIGQLVLADGSHILWAVPDRISAEYKVTENTKQVLVVNRERIPQ